MYYDRHRIKKDIAGIKDIAIDSITACLCIGAGSGGAAAPLEIFWPSWTTFAPPSDFCSGPLFSGNAGFWVKNEDLFFFFFGERWIFGQ